MQERIASYTIMRHLFSRILNIFIPDGHCLLTPDSWEELNRCDVLLCCHDASRGLEVDGKAYSPILDSLAQDLQAAGLKIDRLAKWGSVLVGDRAYGSPKGVNRLVFIFKIKRIIRSWASKVSIIADGSHWPRNPYDRILEITNCKCVIVIGANELLIHSARGKGIHVIELLHGIGFTPVPWGWDKLDISSLPTGVLSLDAISTKTFKQLECKGVKVKQVSHPWFRRYNVSGKSGIPDQLKQKISDHNYTSYILVSLAWGYDGEPSALPGVSGVLPNGVIPEALIEAIQNTKESVFWFLRLHPVQMNNEYRYWRHIKLVNNIVEENPNAESAVSSTCELRTILSHCIGHISMCSSTCYEASFMGVPSLLMCPTLAPGEPQGEKFPDLREEGFVELKVRPKSSDIVQWALRVNRQAPKNYGEGAEDWGEVVRWMLGDDRN